MKHTRSVALSGVTAALAVVILLIGSMLGIGTYAAPMLAGLCLLPAGQKLGRKYHALLWLAVSILSFLLVTDVEASLMFFALFGCYPILRPLFQRLPAGLRIAAKLMFFFTVTIAAEALLMLVLVPEVMQPGLIALLLVLGTVTFLLYDLLIPRAQLLMDRYLGKFFRN